MNLKNHLIYFFFFFYEKKEMVKICYTIYFAVDLFQITRFALNAL